MYWTLKRLLMWSSIVLAVGVIVLYSYIQARGIIAGPAIMLSEPENGITATTSLIEIRGQVTHAKSLTLDGRTVFVDLAGYFDEHLLLLPGYNIIELVAKDGEGRETRKVLELVFTEEPREALASSTSQ